MTRPSPAVTVLFSLAYALAVRRDSRRVRLPWRSIMALSVEVWRK